jgi:hypothetical protein
MPLRSQLVTANATASTAQPMRNPISGETGSRCASTAVTLRHAPAIAPWPTPPRRSRRTSRPKDIVSIPLAKK